MKWLHNAACIRNEIKSGNNNGIIILWIWGNEIYCYLHQVTYQMETKWKLRWGQTTAQLRKWTENPKPHDTISSIKSYGKLITKTAVIEWWFNIFSPSSLMDYNCQGAKQYLNLKKFNKNCSRTKSSACPNIGGENFYERTTLRCKVFQSVKTVVKFSAININIIIITGIPIKLNGAN